MGDFFLSKRARTAPHWFFIVAAFWVSAADSLRAETITLPNASFESPITPYAGPFINFWQDAPKPAWYDETGPFTWDQLTGVFLNTPFGSFDHIDNCDGNQAAFLFVVPEVAIFQDYDSIDWSQTSPSHAFDVKFEAGKSYHLIIGIIGGGGGMLEGASLELAFYYRDALSNKVIVAATNVVHSQTVFSNRTHLVDCHLDMTTVKAGATWVGKNMGVQILSTVATNLVGGYWDLDNVRIFSIKEPMLLNPAVTNNQFTSTLQSEPALRVEILTSTNLATTNWSSLGVLTNSTGTMLFTNAISNFEQRFYRARRLPD